MDIRYISSSGYQLWPYKNGYSGIGGEGLVELDYGWQLIAVPIKYGYWDTLTHKHVHDNTTAKFKNYILDQITDLYGPGIVEVANTYLGDLQAFLSYVVGSTPESSPNNFNLVYQDGDSQEVSGFWIKIIGNNHPYTITWG